MTSIPIRIKVRCPACSTAIALSQEQYRDLVKMTRLGLVCPNCGHDFEYKSVPSRSQSRRWEAELDREPAPAPFPAAQASAPEFPPPPFALLGGGTPANATPPAFAPLTGAAFSPSPAALSPQGAATPTGGDATKLTLNERWKRLPPWVQWTVIGAVVLLLAVVIFALPSGGSGSSDSEKSKGIEHSQPKSDKNPSDAETKSDQDKKAEPEKTRANDEKKASDKASKENKGS